MKYRSMLSHLPRLRNASVSAFSYLAIPLAVVLPELVQVLVDLHQPVLR